MGNKSKIVRNMKDKWVAGVLSGISKEYGINKTVLRILFLLSLSFSGGISIFVYLVLTFVIPKEVAIPETKKDFSALSEDYDSYLKNQINAAEAEAKRKGSWRK